MKGLRNSALCDFKLDSDQNPMDGLANLADLMLVLACGLMLSLVMHWNVDLAGSGELVGMEQGAQVQELDGLTESSSGDLKDQSGYEEMGKVYKDPKTGKLYMVTNK